MPTIVETVLDVGLTVLRELGAAELAGKLIGEAINHLAGDGLEKEVSKALRVASQHIDPDDEV